MRVLGIPCAHIICCHIDTKKHIEVKSFAKQWELDTVNNLDHEVFGILLPFRLQRCKVAIGRTKKRPSVNFRASNTWRGNLVSGSVTTAMNPATTDAGVPHVSSSSLSSTLKRHVEVGLPTSLPSVQFSLSAMPQPSHAQRLIVPMHLTQPVQHTTIPRQSIPAQGTQSRIDCTTPPVLHTTILRPSDPVQAPPPRYPRLMVTLKKANAKRLGSFLIRLSHSDSLSEVAQKYAQFRKEYIPNIQFTITIY
uniref:Uncharacterized protein n=1 Tax=Hyaloperonospora arabidopsidis (strain Emoy2) TaxID=559515 RepID=M4BB14_HYAAE